MPAGTLAQLQGLLKKEGLRLSAAALIPFSLSAGEGELRTARLEALCAAVEARAELAFERGGLKERLVFSGLLNSTARLMIPREDAKFALSDACDGCGVCARLCPAANIELCEGRPTWLRGCEQCGACFAWCPKEAISGTCLAAKTRYRNPFIELGELLSAARPAGNLGAPEASLRNPAEASA